MAEPAREAAKVKSIFVYPIKSCRGISVSRAPVSSTGFRWDRQWLVANSKGTAYTQRVEPKLALVEVELPNEAFSDGWEPNKSSYLVIRAPGMNPLKVPLCIPSATTDGVSVWEWSGSAFDEGDEASKWFSNYLGKSSRLVRFNEDMKPPSIGQNKGKGKKTDKTRRVWGSTEEEVLITALKELCTTGWKCDNGTFRSGYTVVLEKAMIKAFPSTDLKANPHIESKIKMWKKSYGSLACMLGKSGFGWNHSDHMITVDSDDVWENYVKVDPEAKSMRFKSWPYYEDWIEIFGKDRATGEHAEGLNDAVNDIEKEKDGEHDCVEGLEEISINPDTPYHTTPSSSKQVKDGRKDKGKKRKTSDDQGNGLGAIAEVIANFTEKTEARLGMIAERIGYEHDMSASRKQVYPALCSMTWLSQEEKLRAAKRITSDDQSLDLFFSLPDEDKSGMVQMILDGKM